MSKDKIPHINTPDQVESFNAHLRDDFNDRILFSGPFGAGKTTFLKEYFLGQKDLLVLKLFPVYYSLSANQDIFELIKLEILYGLLDGFPQSAGLTQDEYNAVVTSQVLRMQNINIEQPVKLMMKAMPALGIGLVDEFAERISLMVDKGSTIGSKPYEHLRKYIDSFKKPAQQDYQNDQVSELVTSLLSRVKVSMPEETKTVLLIDDLDRLDPEHVFRLFNIFSSHYDEDKSENKFGFDKVIFVCDVNNIQQMFRHRYGLSVEFNGYIDKFYSSEVFHFNIRNYLKESLKDIIQQRADLHRHFSEGDLSGDFIEKYQVKGNGGFLTQISYIMENMIDFDQVRMRNFQRFQGFAIPNRKFSLGRRDWAFAYFPILVLLHNLEKFFARPQDLEDSLEVLYSNYPSNYEPGDKHPVYEDDYQATSTIKHCIPFLIEEEKSFSGGFERNTEYIAAINNEQGKNIYLHYKLGENFHFDYVVPEFMGIASMLRADGTDGNPKTLQRPNPFWFLYLTYKKLRKKGII
ncbi:P-loop NTPase fold protein [Pedobacter sp.]|uniref:P-loop NTPase fold protein n=1 Tax=Pedobacter sp. TaxID=1411316 RepID=UPI003BAD60AA